jgi:hypothetical protein
MKKVWYIFYFVIIVYKGNNIMFKISIEIHNDEIEEL